MAGSTPRYAIHYPTSTDATNIPGDMQTSLDEIDTIIVTSTAGTYASIPNAGIEGRRYFATDVGPAGAEFVDTGSVWLPAGTINSSAGNVSTSLPGATAAPGTQDVSAAADHAHAREPLAVAADIQPTGPVAVAGSSGKWVDAHHVHPGDCIGDIKYSVTGTASVGWVLANGAEVSRTTYATFFNNAGGTASYPWGFGSGGVGGTTFNLPNLYDVVLVGAGNLYTVGIIPGTSTSTTLSVSNLPPHTHTPNDPGHAHGVSDPGHGHLLYVDPGSGGSTSYQLLYTIPSVGTTFFTSSTQGTGYVNFSNSAAAQIKKNTTGITATQTQTTGLTLQNTGSGTPFSNLQPSAGVYVLVKVL